MWGHHKCDLGPLKCSFRLINTYSRICKIIPNIISSRYRSVYNLCLIKLFSGFIEMNNENIGYPDCQLVEFLKQNANAPNSTGNLVSKSILSIIEDIHNESIAHIDIHMLHYLVKELSELKGYEGIWALIKSSAQNCKICEALDKFLPNFKSLDMGIPEQA